MPEDIVNSYNLWVDTDAANQAGQQRGDEFNIALGSQTLKSESGQYIKLTLQNFHMYKNWQDVNKNNNKFHLVIPGPGPYPDGGSAPYDPNNTEVLLAERSYTSNCCNFQDARYAFATDLANQIAGTMAAWSAASAITAEVIEPKDPTSLAPPGIYEGGDNIIHLRLTQTVDWNNPVTEINLQCWESDGESYNLFGANRLAGDNIPPTASSCRVVRDGGPLPGTDVTWDFYFLYPMQLQTQPYIYMHSRLSNFSIETSSLSQPYETTRPTTDVATSTILAKIPVGKTECVYDAPYESVYFLNIYDRHVNSVYLSLRDERNRPIGRLFNSSSLSASVDELAASYTTGRSAQSTLGNLQFSCVFKVDIVQAMLPNERLFAPIPNPLNPKTSGLLLDPSKPPNDNDTNPALRALTLAENARLSGSVVRTGGALGRR